MDAFHARLRELASTCTEDDQAKEVRAQVIQGCRDKKLRTLILRQPRIALEDILLLARSHELSDVRASVMDAALTQTAEQAVSVKKERVDAVCTPTRSEKGKWPSQNVRCTFCGYCGKEEHRPGECPARGKTCAKCGILNHFASVCRGGLRSRRALGRRPKARPVRHISEEEHAIPGMSPTTPQKQCLEDSSTEDEEECYLISFANNLKQRRRPQPTCAVEIAGSPVKALIDTGASVNVMGCQHYKKLHPRPPLTPSSIKILAYGSQKPLPLKGKIRVKVKARDQEVMTTCYVIDREGDILVGSHISEDLHLITFAKSVKSLQKEDLLGMFPQLFEGLGCIKRPPVKLHIDPAVKPIALRHRRIPFHLRPLVEQELTKLEQQGVIERVTGPTPGVSPMVIAEKPKQPGQIRICIDMRMPNLAIKRERHLTPTVDDILADLNGSQWFSKLNLNAGYHQLRLEEESRYITTFSTHVGLRRYKKLNFGISSAAEIFQNAVRELLSGLQGVINVSDDILIHSATIDDHRRQLRATLKRLAEHGVTLNKDKCQIFKKSIEFFGYVFNQDSVKVDPKKSQAIRLAQAPTSVSEVRSFLGMATYCGRFIPNLATIAEPLRKLTKKEASWRWTSVEDEAFEKIKSGLLESTTMAYFNTARQTELIVDASPVGLGALLTQETEPGIWAPLAFASKALTETEKWYSQIEREALAIKWPCNHFHLYISGRPIRVVTDHQPLLPLFKGTAPHPPPRIERWATQLQHYQMELIYRPGAKNPADFLSRHPELLDGGDADQGKKTEEFVNKITQWSCPRTLTLEEIKTHSDNDAALQRVATAILKGSWEGFLHQTQEWSEPDRQRLEKLWRVRNELSASDGSIILRGSRIVIPYSLQERATALAHEGHQSIGKMKARMREKVWFPGLEEAVDAVVRTCRACQINGSQETPAPVVTEDPAPSPWSWLSLDFGSFPDGRITAVVVDSYTKYPVVEVIPSTAFHHLQPMLERTFALFGLPQVIKTDNGPPFQGGEFKQFLNQIGVKHRRITPQWPQANGEVEQFMRTLNKTLRIAAAEQSDPERAIHRFLREYRGTPHSTTQRSPWSLMLAGPRRDNIPTAPDWESPPYDPSAAQAKRAATNQRATQKRRARTRELHPGCQVLVRNRRGDGKFRTAYEPEVWTVRSTNGTAVTAERDGETISRNVSWFKQIPSQEREELAGDIPWEDYIFPGDISHDSVADVGRDSHPNTPSTDHGVMRQPEQQREMSTPVAHHTRHHR